MCIILFLTSSIDIWIINTCYFFKKLTVYMYEALKKKAGSFFSSISMTTLIKAEECLSHMATGWV